MTKILTLVFSLIAAAALVFILMNQGTGRSRAAVPPDVVVAAPQEAPEGMTWIPGGRFRMGTPLRPGPNEPNPDKVKQDEYPAHDVILDGFYIDKFEVTNAQFVKFVEDTGYITVAERTPKREDFAGMGIDINQIPEENLVAGGLCFNRNFDRESFRDDYANWEYQAWAYVPGANWRHPEGPGSSIDEIMDHPVVQIAYEDAATYAKWAGKRLPTEAEWEYASRGGREDTKYPWGEELTPDGKYMCNYFQGTFPTDFQNRDGFETTSPVGSFPPNGYGLYDMSGNIWEWTADLYHHDYYSVSPPRNPQGPETSFDPGEPGIVKRVTRGGSFMCNTNNCTGYRCAARMRSEVDSGAFHTGFRCVVSADGVDGVRD